MSQPWNAPEWLKAEEKHSRMQLAINNLKLVKMHSAAEQVIKVAQGILTGLNVSDIKSGSPIHLHLRKTLIEYRQEIETLKK